MIEFIRMVLEASPMLALFLAIATGYALGQVSVAGVSFGAGAVLFTGLIIGAIAPKAAPPATKAATAAAPTSARTSTTRA